MERLADGADLSGEPLPAQSLVELCGDRRVFIENHFGVVQYSCDKISVKVRYGTISVGGKELELLHMTRDQLVISGEIDNIVVNRR